MKRYRSLTTFAALAALGLVALVPAQAQVSFGTGGFGGGSGNVNIGSDQDNTMSVTANIDNGLDIVNVTSSELLNSQGIGQASFEAVDGLINNIAIDLDPDGSLPRVFQRFTANPQDGTGDLSLAIDYVGTTSGTLLLNNVLSLGNGENRFELTADAGYYISKVTVNAPGGFDLFKQIRILDVSTYDPETHGTGDPSVPEPGTWALLCGLGVSGTALLRRRAAVK